MIDMDPESLPGKCLVDTGVLIRALGQFHDDRIGAPLAVE
jgi:hypothetical protein